MNNRKKTKRRKMSRKKKNSKFLPPKKKIRGKIKKRDHMVKIHSVSDVDFVISTSFAKYRIPRSCCHFFKDARQQDLQHVEFYKSHTYQYKCCFVFIFHWYDLDVRVSAPNFDEFRIIETNDLSIKNETWKDETWREEMRRISLSEEECRENCE